MLQNRFGAQRRRSGGEDAQRLGASHCRHVQPEARHPFTARRRASRHGTRVRLLTKIDAKLFRRHQPLTGLGKIVHLHHRVLVVFVIVPVVPFANAAADFFADVNVIETALGASESEGHLAVVHNLL